MRTAILNITGNLVALTCAISAFYLALHDKGGWGWFLFIALLTSAHYSSGSSKKPKKKKEEADE